MKLDATKKVLILRFSSIGDIVLTTPVVRCLQKQTGATVHFVCKTPFAPILTANPYIDRVYTFDKDIKTLKNSLQAENYDVILDLHKNIRSKQICRWLKAPTYSFPKLNLEKWLLVQFGIHRLPDIHIVDRYMKAVAFARIQNDGAGLDYFIPPEAVVDTRQWLPDGAPFVAFAIGAAHATKRLPDHKIIEIVQQIPQPILLLGGKAEEATGNRIQQAAGTHIHNLCGKLSIHQSASVVQQARVVLTHDTGMMHIAAAFQQHIISVWGNTIPAFGMYPYLKNNVQANIIQVDGLGCRPCSKIGYQKCPKGHFKCMEQIDTTKIVARVRYYFKI